MPKVYQSQGNLAGFAMRVLALVALIISSVMAWGRGASVRTDGDILVVNGLPVVRFRNAQDNDSPAERARAAAAVLVSASSADAVVVRPDANKVIVALGSDTILTVTQRDGANPLAIANDWASKIRHALTLPPLRIGDDLVKVPITGSVDISVIGKLCEYVNANSSDRRVATVDKTPYGIRVRGVSSGRTSIVVGSGNSDDQSVTVVVQPFAAPFPQAVTAYVCGSPATSSTVEGAIYGAIRTQLKCEQGAVLDFSLKNVPALGVGQSRTFSINTKASCFQCIDNSGEVQVTVVNTPSPAKDDRVLWYSNDPESVKQPGPLFMSSLESGQSARLLYHHLNASSISMLLRVQAINNSDEPLKVLLIPGDSKPDRNPVRAGMRAATEFLPGFFWNSGEIFTIPPRSTLPLSLRRFSPGETVSGLCSIRLVSGSGLMVRTDAWPPFDLEQQWKNTIYTSTPWREVGCHPINEFDRSPCEPSVHVYPNPYKVEDCHYTVGGRFATIRLGEAPIATADSHRNLDGNYGVLYSIRTSITNPTRSDADVELVMESSSGYTTGLFYVGDKLVSTPYLGPKDTTRIASFHVLAGGSIRTDILTVPISGGSYPVTITLRPVSARSASKSR